MGKHGGDRVPAHFRTRRVMAFEMIGVQLDKTRDDVVSAHVLAGAGGPRLYGGNQAVAQQKRTLDDFVGQHDAGIGENGFGGHLGRSYLERSAIKSEQFQEKCFAVFHPELRKN
jgi:hypothetical protein